jgi:hypothetical protein
MTAPTADGVSIEQRSAVLHVRFDRPARKNSLDAPFVRRIVSDAELSGAVAALVGELAEFREGLPALEERRPARFERR